jgi:hypothetical protein
MFKLWTDTMSNGFPGMDAYQNMYKNMMPNFNEYWGNLPNVAEYWNKVSQSITNPQSAWTNLFNAVPTPADFTKLWSYKIPGMDVYTQVFDLWKGMGDPVAFLQNSQEKYGSALRRTVRSGLIVWGIIRIAKVSAGSKRKTSLMR